MEIIYLYWFFSVVFMIASAIEDSISGTKQNFFIYFAGVLLSPIALPFALGMSLTKGDKDV